VRRNAVRDLGLRTGFVEAAEERATIADIESYIKKGSVDPYSWWEVQELTVDSMNNPKHIGWYGRRGGKLKRQPFAKAVQLFQKCKADPDHHLNV
jgi:hypothetical protein